MPIAPGSRLGAYEIVSAVGAGGMGEVYRARDPRLDRTVAIKVLAPHLAADRDLRERFDREARAISSLSHPNICVVYDVGHQEGIDFLVMEYLDGETLAQRLTRGALSPDDVFTYAIQMANALDRAHRQGIVHRDLKPANVMIVKGAIKLLDFGLAKIGAAVAGTAGLSVSMPTREQPLTARGSILGTFQYMAPEQIEGGEADPRSDIFAFGAIVYEMATGRRAFEGKTHASLIGAILKDQPPPVSTFQRIAPPALDHLIARCLAKDPEERWQSAHDIATQLAWIQQTGSPAGAPAAVRSRRPVREAIAWTLTAAMTIAAASLAYVVTRPSPSTGSITFTIDETPQIQFGGAPLAPFASVSPDGSRIAFIATHGTVPMLHIRRLDAADVQVIVQAGQITAPVFWSPDSRFIAFLQDAQVRRIDLVGGGVQTICASETLEGLTWNRQNVIVFAGSSGGLRRVPASGGTAVGVTTLDRTRNELSHRHPVFLPDGRRFLYFVQPQNEVFLGSLDGGAPKRLVDADARVLYASGHLLIPRQTALFAQPFDLRRGETSGDPVKVLDTVRVNPGTNARAAFSVSDNGVLVYRPGASTNLAETRWMSRTGKPIGTVLPLEDTRGMALSPDERWIAYHRHDGPTGGGIWARDLVRGTTVRITDGSTHEVSPFWHPSGDRIGFAASIDGSSYLFSRSASGTGAIVRLTDTPGTQQFGSWSRDGRYLLFEVGQTGGNKRHIYTLLIGSREAPKPFGNGVAAEIQPQFSPDARWVAYTSNESSRWEVYVQPFPANGDRYTISTGGGAQPRWRGDGQELYFVSNDSKMIAVSIRTVAGKLEAGVPKELFTIHPSIPVVNPIGFSVYDVSADGQRFVVAELPNPAQRTSDPVYVVTNWLALLKR